MEDDEYQWRPFAAAALTLLSAEERAELVELEAAFPAAERKRLSNDLQRRISDAKASGARVCRDDAELRLRIAGEVGPTVTAHIPREPWERASHRIATIKGRARDEAVRRLVTGEWEAEGCHRGWGARMKIASSEWMEEVTETLDARLIGRGRWGDVRVRRRLSQLPAAAAALMPYGLMISGRSALADSITAGAIPTLESISAADSASGAAGSACPPSRSMADNGLPVGWRPAAEFSLADKMSGGEAAHRSASEYTELVRQAQQEAELRRRGLEEDKLRERLRQEETEREARWATQSFFDPLRDGPLPPRVEPPLPPAPQTRTPAARPTPAAVAPYAAPEVWPTEGLPFRAAVAMMLPQAQRDALLALYARGFPHGPVGFLARSAAEVEAEKQASPLADAGHQALLVELESGVRTAIAYDPAKMERRPVPSEIWRLVPAGCAHLRMEPLPWPGASHPVAGGADAMLIISRTGRPTREVPKDQLIYWREVRVLPRTSLSTAPPAGPDTLAAELTADAAISARDPAGGDRRNCTDAELTATVLRLAERHLKDVGEPPTEDELEPQIHDALPGIGVVRARKAMRDRPERLKAPVGRRKRRKPPLT
ncbi:hypothetical protein [Teichococcus wenyumeiae]|uniref:hypothetical protein n=1 Tax=Teichococcus wenyumeiae TaxID=2478470 RepID=UPI0011C42B4B|nr:hypothetical protein [Pseudoroseomonas wenyumeiae]